MSIKPITNSNKWFNQDPIDFYDDWLNQDPVDFDDDNPLFNELFDSNNPSTLSPVFFPEEDLFATDLPAAIEPQRPERGFYINWSPQLDEKLVELVASTKKPDWHSIATKLNAFFKEQAKPSNSLPKITVAKCSRHYQDIMRKLKKQKITLSQDNSLPSTPSFTSTLTEDKKPEEKIKAMHIKWPPALTDELLRIGEKTYQKSFWEKIATKLNFEFQKTFSPKNYKHHYLLLIKPKPYHIQKALPSTSIKNKDSWAIQALLESTKRPKTTNSIRGSYRNIKILDILPPKLNALVETNKQLDQNTPITEETWDNITDKLNTWAQNNALIYSNLTRDVVIELYALHN